MALDIIRNVFSDGFVKNRIMEFAGPGIAGLSMDFRNGIDVMTTEASCVSTIWQTDSTVKDWLSVHKRENEYREIRPSRLAYYDYLLEVDLGEVKPMIALPFHPSNAYTIEEVNENPEDILRLTEENCNAQMKEFGLKMDLRSKIEHGRLRVDQGVIAGCAGGMFENISKAADILKGSSIGNDIFQLNVYPASQPVFQEVVEKGIASGLPGGPIFARLLRPPASGPVMSRLTADFQYAIQHESQP
ncbi:MAG: aconitase family protein [Eisenbergiella sp.]